MPEPDPGVLASQKEYEWSVSHPYLHKKGVWVDFWNAGRPGPTRIFFPGEGYEEYNPEIADLLEKRLKEGKVFSPLRWEYKRLLKGVPKVYEFNLGKVKEVNVGL